MTNSSENELARLQERVAHQDLVIEELSTQVAEQWKTIEQLQSALKHLGSQIIELEDVVSPAASVKPPHW